MWQLPKGSAAINDDIVDDVDEKAIVDTPDDFRSKAQKSPSSLLRIIDDAHQIGQSMIVCAFASLPTVAVAVDSSGSAYEMDFRSVLFGICSCYVTYLLSLLFLHRRGLLGRSTQSSCFFSGR